MARRVVFPAACSVAIVGPMSSVISVAVIVVHGLSEIIGGGNDFYVVDVIWPFIVDPAHDKSVADGSSVARQLAVSPMTLSARRLENALTQKRFHEANAAVAAPFPQRGDRLPAR